MGGKIFVLGFLLLIASGLWFHRSYMASFGLEQQTSLLEKEAVQEFISMRPFLSQQYADGKLKSQISAKEVRYFSNGRVVFTGDVEYQDRDAKGRVSLVLKTQKAFGDVITDAGQSNILQSKKKLKGASLPEAVRIQVGATDVIETEKVTVDFVAGILQTSETVNLKGPGRVVTGKGFVYQIESQDYKLGGPVRATLEPKSRPAEVEKRGEL